MSSKSREKNLIMGKFGYSNKRYIGALTGIFVVMMFCSTASATWMDKFGSSGWQEFADDNNDGAGGGQKYDHEYYFWKLEGKDLSIGVQSGFDLGDGRVNRHQARDIFLGDLALSFDGDTNGNNGTGYEYAYDFGQHTEGYTRHNNISAGTDDGLDQAGLYENVVWDNDTLQTQHNSDSVAPYAMDDGDLVAEALNPDAWGKNRVEDTNGDGVIDSSDRYSFYRIAKFSVEDLINPDGSLTVDAHITMSCGNDVMNGSFEIPPSGEGQIDVVPEPSTIALLGVGLAGLAVGAARRRLKKKKAEQ